MKVNFKLVYVLMIVLLAIIVAVFSSGCSIEKFFSRQRSDSTIVAKTQTEKKDSTSAGSVNTTNNKSKEDYEWWRVILENMPKIDSNVTVNNIYPAPARVIYEGGTGKIEQEVNSKDSTWFYQLALLIKATTDSTNKRIDNLEKKKDVSTPGLGLWTLIIVAGGAVIFFKLLGYAGSNFTITKKVRQ